MGGAAVMESPDDFTSAKSARRCCADRMLRSNATGSKLKQISCSRARTASEVCGLAVSRLCGGVGATIRFTDACAIALSA